MRQVLCGTRLFRTAAVLIAVAALAGSSAAPASSEAGYGPKVDPELAAYASTSDPNSSVSVILFGKNLERIAKKHHMRVRNKLDAVLQGHSGKVKVGELGKLESEPDVQYIVRDTPVIPTGFSVGDLESTLRKSVFPDVDRAEKAWGRGLTGNRVGIAVVDSGVLERGTRDFGNRILKTDGFNQGADSYGHGTFVAHIAAGISGVQADGTRFMGIAPNASVYSYNVANGDATYTSDVIAGLAAVRYYKNHFNLRVAVLALQETVPSSYLANALDAAVQELWKDGVVVVVAAGNRGPGLIDYAPANSPHAITVGATDANGTIAIEDDIVASFSSSGVTYDGYAKPEMLAPGRRIAAFLPPKSTLASLAPLQNWVGPEYAILSGTSFAAPQVAAAAAILVEQHPEWTPDQIKWVLMNTSRSVTGTTAGALDLDTATSFAGTLDRANKGIRPTKYGLHGSLTTDFKANTWTANTWTANTWTANTWTANTWTANTWTALDYFDKP